MFGVLASILALHTGNEWSKDTEQPQGTAETWGLEQDFERAVGSSMDFFSYFYFEMDSHVARDDLELLPLSPGSTS